jgi:antitoxin (DNA-binding transcriptional repressor) of toxin-antitoxin stability system
MEQGGERIAVEELRARLPEVLRRARDGERFVVFEDGRDLVTIGPAPGQKVTTLREFLERWETIPKPDPEFWDELEQIQASQPMVPPPPNWDS